MVPSTRSAWLQSWGYRPNKGKKYNENDLEEVYTGPVYLNIRSVSVRLDLDPGTYIIIPSKLLKNF